MDRLRGFHVTYEPDQPFVHVHMWTTDEAFQKQGWGQSEFVCHGCGHYWLVIYPARAVDAVKGQGWPPITKTLAEFKKTHAAHAVPFAAMESLCPPYEREPEIVADLRTAA